MKANPSQLSAPCAEEAIASLFAAFSDAPIPSLEQLHGVLWEEREWVEFQFLGKRWDEVEFVDGKWYDALQTSLSDDAFRYYIVAVLYQTLRQKGECLAVYMVQNSLRGNEAILRPLSRDQLLVISEVVRCIADLVPGPQGYGFQEDHERLVDVSRQIRQLGDEPKPERSL